MSKDREILANAYNNAGREFLASRLAYIFTHIENQDQVAVHNLFTKELDVMIGDDNAANALVDIADLILMYSKKGL